MRVAVDELAWECPRIDGAWRLNSEAAWLTIARGQPEHVRSDRGVESTA
jgi:hypothetical protein